MLGAVRGAAEESTFRAFNLVSPDVLDRVLDAWRYGRRPRRAASAQVRYQGLTLRGLSAPQLGEDGTTSAGPCLWMVRRIRR